MEKIVLEYVEYLKATKGISVNTEMAYRRDLMKLVRYLAGQDIYKADEVTSTNLTSYMLFMEKHQLTNTTISRNVASIKGFFHYLLKKKYITEDVSDCLTSPKVEKASAAATRKAKSRSAQRRKRTKKAGKTNRGN